MTTLQKLLNEKEITSVVIIDDGFDIAPLPNDLNEADWDLFLDDLKHEDRSRLSELYPKLLTSNNEALTNSPEFVKIVWDHRDEFPDDSTNAIFKNYDHFQRSEKKTLNQITQILENIGLTCISKGRDLDEDVLKSDLILIDLYLGSQHSDDDLNLAVDNIKKFIQHRATTPPLIILMSSRDLLYDMRNRFRDEAQLHASMFRVAHKSELIQDGKLELILLRLVRNYEDAKKYASFLDAWKKRLLQTPEMFLQHFRKLDLSDLNQLRTLLLNAEGEQLGNYLLDVTDRVLQYSIEENPNVINAALELNKIQLDEYPAPHLTGTSDFQDLVYRMQFMHKNRLRLTKNDQAALVQFGDIIGQINQGPDGGSDDVFLVITPACDLMRNGISQIMMLPGKLNELLPSDWSYSYDPLKTPILTLPNDERKWVKWNPREVQTILHDDLKSSLTNGDLIQIARLRELYALDLQQRVLQRLGRIGLTANLPAVFPVDISFCYANSDGQAHQLEINHQNPAACYVGRTKNSKPIHHLVLSEQTCDQIGLALSSLSEESVHPSTHRSVKTAKQNLELISQFEQGKVEISPQKGTKHLHSPSGQILVAILRNHDNLKSGTVLDKNARKAAIILHVEDLLNEVNSSLL